MHDTMACDSVDRTPDLLRVQVREVMEAAWVGEAGYTAPNPKVYPWRWLWDSCFHALIWHELGVPNRAITELRSVLSAIDGSGFVPHMGYPLDPQRPLELWGRRATSSITQPPMYGHVLSVALQAGLDGAAELVEPARRGLLFLLRRRSRDRSGLLRVTHPWETGCDDTPRWDDYCPGDGFDRGRWADHKINLLGTVERGDSGEPLDNPAFGAAPVSFSALTAWNGLELAAVTGDDLLADLSGELAAAVDDRWEPKLANWTDAGVAESGSGRVRTTDGLLGMLVTADAQHKAQVEEALCSPDAYGGEFGPRGVHRHEAVYDPVTYWRGPVWPQFAYLLAQASSQPAARRLARATLRGAVTSGFAEYWNAETGAGGGAIPQSWTGLVLLSLPVLA